jgi:hypothetical protein
MLAPVSVKNFHGLLTRKMTSPHSFASLYGMNVDSLKLEEERKRERHLTPLERWRLIQDMITWGESQVTVRRNTRERRLYEQRLKNQDF